MPIKVHAHTHRGLLTSAFLFLALFHGAQEKHGKLVTAPCTARYSGEWLHNYLWSLCTPWYAYKILWRCRQGRCAVDSSLLACFAGLQWGFCWPTARSLTGINLNKCTLCLAFCIHVPNFLLTKYQTFIVKKYTMYFSKWQWFLLLLKVICWWKQLLKKKITRESVSLLSVSILQLNSCALDMEKL